MLYSVAEGDTVERAGKKVQLVTMGINPSKADLHLGHYLTMYQALKVLHDRPDARGHIFVDDREHHAKIESRQHEGLFRVPSSRTAQQIQGLVLDFIARFAGTVMDPTLRNRICVQRMSDYFRESVPDGGSRGGELYWLLREHRAELRELFEFRDDIHQEEFLRPVCSQCGFGPRYEQDMTIDDQGMGTACIDPGCGKGEYRVNPYVGDSNWSIHYAVDPVRDTFLAEQYRAQRVLHVFGGDYGQPWGTDGTPKAERLGRFMRQMDERRIRYFVGPLLQKGGRKLAKSHGDSTPPPSLEELEAILRQKRAVVNVA